MGFLIERIVIRPLFDAPRVILLVATAGVALLAIGVEIWFGTAQAKSVAKPFDQVDRVAILGRAGLRPAAAADRHARSCWPILLGLFFTRTNLGLAILGASQEPTATELVGISVRRLSSFTWVLAALLGGLAALIAVPDGGSFAPGIMTSTYLIPAFTAAVLGGMTSLPGAFLGGIIVGSHPVGGHERPDLRGHPRHAGHAGRVHRAARRARSCGRRACLGKALR